MFSLVQKALTRLQISGARKRRQALPKAPSVGFFHQARIAHHQYAAIGFGANQAARALLERNHCLRQLIGHKGVLSLLRERVQTGGKHRVVRRRERQFIDDDPGKRFSSSVRLASPCINSGKSQSRACKASRNWAESRSTARSVVHSTKARPPEALITGNTALSIASLKAGDAGAGRPRGTYNNACCV